MNKLDIQKLLDEKESYKQAIKLINDVLGNFDLSAKEIKVSDHAVLRYLERVKGIDIDAVREEITPKYIRTAIKKLKEGKFYLADGTELRVKDETVLTVVGADE